MTSVTNNVRTTNAARKNFNTSQTTYRVRIYMG